jgi:hypothetical protein
MRSCCWFASLAGHDRDDAGDPDERPRIVKIQPTSSDDLPLEGCKRRLKTDPCGAARPQVVNIRPPLAGCQPTMGTTAMGAHAEPRDRRSRFVNGRTSHEAMAVVSLLSLTSLEVGLWLR